MKIWTVLVSKDWYYVWENWELPTGRPEWDKEFITNLCKGKIILCSINTMKWLPQSIIDNAMWFTTRMYASRDINFGIDTFKAGCDLFIVIHTTEDMNKGKKFKFKFLENKYNKIMYMNNISLYVKK